MIRAESRLREIRDFDPKVCVRYLHTAQSSLSIGRARSRAYPMDGRVPAYDDGGLDRLK